MEIELQEVSDENENPEVDIDDIIEDAVSDIEEKKVEIGGQTSKPPTYKGNAYDVTSLLALCSGLLILFTCLTCGMGLYVMPFLAIIPGIVGVVMAKKSVDPQRTQLLSWLGIGSGTVVLFISLAGIAIYVILLLVFVRSSGYSHF